MKTLKDLKENAAEVFEFTDGDYIYKRDTDAVNVLNTVFDNILYVFREDVEWNKKSLGKKGTIAFDSSHTYIVTTKGVFMFSNSEWASITKR
jgi:hypothetical protein